MNKYSCIIGASVSLAASASFCWAAPAAHALVVQYSSKAAFEAALAPGAYTETKMFDNYPNYSGGSGFSYTALASGGRYKIGVNELSSNSRGYLRFTFGPGIRAFGGYLYPTNSNGTLSAQAFTISLNNDSFVVTKTSSSTTTFHGFISDTDLVNASISLIEPYPTAGNVIVGTSRVPGPLPLLGAGAAFGWSQRLRRRQAADHFDA